jgi:hypothetical protein
MTAAGDRFAELYELAGAQCEGLLSPQQLARLEELVLADADQRRQYVLYMHTLAQIEEATQEGAGIGPACQAGLPVGPAYRAGLSAVEPSAPGATSRPFPSIIHYSSTLHPLLGVLSSYAVASLILIAGILAAWARDSRMPGVAQRASQVVAGKKNMLLLPIIAHRGAIGVGKVTRLTDCQWADLTYALAVGADVCAGQVLTLASGSLEITYLGGAKVTLEGPAIFMPGPRNNGMLVLGKVRVETPRATDRPLFCVYAGAAAVTETGGCCFGASVDRAGQSGVYAFRGRIDFRIPGCQDQTPCVVEERNWALVELGPDHVYRVIHAFAGKKAPEFANEWLKAFPVLAGETKRENTGHKRSPNS